MISRPSRPALLGGAAIGLLAVVLVAPAYWRLHIFFQPYDDEGTMLVTLRAFAEGGAPYTDYYSQYGPFWLELFGGFFALTGRTVTHDAGRLLVMAMWIVSSTLMGAAVRRMTGSVALGLAGMLVTFRMLDTLAGEPMHPSGLVGMLIVVGVAAPLLLAERTRVALATIGAVAVALALTKVNVGGFLGVAALYALLVTRGRQPSRLRDSAAVLVLVGLPIALLVPHFEQPNVPRYALLVAAGALAVALVTIAEPRLARLAGVPAATWLVIGGAVLGVPTLLLPLIQGTAPADLFQGVLIAPTRQPEAFAFALALPAAALVAALALSVPAALAVRLGAGRGRVDPVLAGVARVAAGVAMWAAITDSWPLDFGPEVVPFALPVALAWVGALPSSRDAEQPPVRAYLRAFLPAAAVAESLQAYPVAGSQVAFGSLLFIALGAVCMADGLALVRSALAARDPGHALAGDWTAAALSLALLAACLYGFAVTPWRYNHGIYAGNKPLPFAEASHVRLAPPQADEITTLVVALQENCKALVTLPGQNSLYLWSHLAPPAANATHSHWWSLVPADQQRAAVARLRTQRDVCALRNNGLVAFWNGGRPLPGDSPLLQFIEDEFKPLRSLGSNQILKRR